MTFRVETARSEHLTLEIMPDIGASVLNLRAASGRPVMREVEPGSVQTSSQCASFTLLPFSNRIADARFVFGNETVQLRPTTGDGLTQHGDVRNRPWQVTRVGEGHLRCDFDSRDFADMNWPWAFTARVEYLLHGPHLDTSVTLTNTDTRVMPAGLGLHPYFTRRQDGQDARLSFGADLTYDTDGRHLPTGGARPLHPDEDYRRPDEVGRRTIDQTYAAWDGVARMDWASQDGSRSLVLTADTVYSHLVVYTAPDGSLALEPVTHSTDAFNLAARGVDGCDMRTLTPGQSLAGTARITLEGAW